MQFQSIIKRIRSSEITKGIVTYTKTNDVRFKLIILAIICGFMLLRGIMQQPQILENKTEIERLHEEIDYEKARQSEIENMQESIDTDEYFEKIARDKLGMIKQNEKVFVDVSTSE